MRKERTKGEEGERKEEGERERKTSVKASLIWETISPNGRFLSHSIQR